MSSLNIDEFINVDASLYATFLLNGTPNTNLLNDSNISLLALTMFVLNSIPKFSNVSAHSISLSSESIRVDVLNVTNAFFSE